jgi:hypothetical protein
MATPDFTELQRRVPAVARRLRMRREPHRRGIGGAG